MKVEFVNNIKTTFEDLEKGQVFIIPPHNVCYMKINDCYLYVGGIHKRVNAVSISDGDMVFCSEYNEVISKTAKLVVDN